MSHRTDRPPVARPVPPMLAKRGLVARPGVDPLLVQMNQEMLIDITRSGREKLAPLKRNLAVRALDVQGDIASAKVTTPAMPFYVHLAKQKGAWRVVNVLGRVPAGPTAR